MDCRMPSFPFFHYLLELAQIHVHWVGDTIQPTYPLSSPSPLAFHLSQNQGLFQWVCDTKKILKFHTHTHTHTQSLSVVPGRGLKSHPTQTKGRALRVLHSQYVLLCKTILLPSWWEMRLLSYRSKSTSCAGPVLLMWTMDSQLQHTWNTCFLPLNTSCDPVRALVAQTVKNLPATLETWVRFLGQEDRLEEGMAPHSSILAWRIPRPEEPGGLQSIGL